MEKSPHELVKFAMKMGLTGALGGSLLGLSGDLNGDYLIAPQCLARENFQILCFGPMGNTSISLLDQNPEFGNISYIYWGAIPYQNRSF